MAPMAIECPIAGCDLGEKTPERGSHNHGTEKDPWSVVSHQQVQAAASVPVINRNMGERQKKSSAVMEMIEVIWLDFLNQWARYKRSSGVGGQDVGDDLVLCLSNDLRMEVASELGESLDDIEEDLMEAIKRMAVLASIPMVHRIQMKDRKHGVIKKVMGFVARVRETAMDCKFEVQCNEDLCGKMVSYKEEIIRDQCVFGWRCKDTQGPWQGVALFGGCHYEG